MSVASFCILSTRSLILISGEEAQHFLQNLVTCDMDDIDQTGAGFGALLTPQGKILFDFFIAKTETGYLIDTPAESAAELLKRLTFYRLRAKVTLEALPGWAAAASFGGESVSPQGILTITDPRLAALGKRHYGPSEVVEQSLSALGKLSLSAESYKAQRIVLGVPESLSDFAYSDIFPHDADMDQLNGVSFTKGCYVGQEVVSRMQHRATARKRMIQVTADGVLPEAGTPILAGGKPVGDLRSSEAAMGIGLVRLDKAQAARAAGAGFSCGGVAVFLEIPQWAGFSWPDAG